MRIKSVASFGVALALAAAPVFADGQKLNVGGIEGSGGTIKGVVKFEGKEAKPKEINVAQDAQCVAAHKDHPLVQETYLFGDNHTLQNVFVWVSGGLEGKTFPAPAQKPEIDQEGCHYSPHVMGVMRGEDILIKNSDNTTHNVHLYSKQISTFNKSMQPGTTETIKFNKPEMDVNFKCDVHPWMGAFVQVVDNPFYAVTQQDGTFEIHGLPAGEYELSFWHEFKKFAPDHEHLTVKVEDGKTAEVTVTYAPKH